MFSERQDVRGKQSTSIPHHRTDLCGTNARGRSALVNRACQGAFQEVGNLECYVWFLELRAPRFGCPKAQDRFPSGSGRNRSSGSQTFRVDQNRTANISNSPCSKEGAGITRCEKHRVLTFEMDKMPCSALFLCGLPIRGIAT